MKAPSRVRWCGWPIAFFGSVHEALRDDSRQLPIVGGKFEVTTNRERLQWCKLPCLVLGVVRFVILDRGVKVQAVLER